MRELTFAIEFDEGVDPFVDAFIDHPQLRSDAIASCVRRDRVWRIERFVGPTDALDEIERHRFDRGTSLMSTTEGCDAERHHERLERSASTLVVYTFIERLHTCNSVTALAARHLDLGHVFQFQRRDNCQEWRLLMRSEANIQVFYDAVEEHLRDGIALHIGRLGEVDQWNFDSLGSVSLSGKERETLQSAIESGYYETPREITVSELADRLGVPQSTASYRLRRAESKLAKGYFRESARSAPGEAIGGLESPDA